MVQKFFKAFGTLNNITIFDISDDKAVDETANILRDASARWSVFEPESEVSCINRMAGKDFTPVNGDTFDLLKQSVRFSEITGGAFDITVHPLIDAYNKGTFVDGKENALWEYVNYKALLFDDASSAVMLKHTGQMLSLGAIAKGYAADMCMKFLKSRGAQNVLINLGGTVAVSGDERQAGIRNPFYKEGVMCTLPVKNAVLSTSGAYERTINACGKTFCHIFDIKAHKPAETDLLSATILSSNGALADALSTAVFASGADAGGKLCKKLNVGAIFADNNLNIYATKNLKGVLNVREQTVNDAAPA